MIRTPFKIISGLLFLLGLLVIPLMIEHYRGASRLGQWRRAAQARGEKLTVAELAPPHPPGQRTVSPDDLPALLFASDRTAKFSKAREALVTHLRMSTVPPGRVPVAWQRGWEWKDVAESTNTWAEAAAKVEAVRPLLQVIKSNLAERAWVIQTEYAQGFRCRIVQVFDFINSAKVLAAAVAVDLHQHRLEDARENLLCLPRLAEVLSAQQTAIEQIGRCAVGNISIPAAWQALQAPGWTEPQLAQLQSTWQSQRYLSNVIRALQMERAIGDEGGFGHARASLTDSTQLVNELSAAGQSTRWVMAWRYAWLDQDQWFYDRALQEPIDFTSAVLSAKSCRTAWHQRLPASATSAAQDLQAPPFTSGANISTRYDRTRYPLSRMLLLKTADLVNSVIALENCREMLLAAVGLKRYELRHGRSAPSLAALVPEYLNAVPVDYMDGQPLRYRLQEDGTWRLYSIGWDGKDDGGDPTPASPGQKYETYSDGRDWVWPVPATPPDRGKAR